MRRKLSQRWVWLLGPVTVAVAGCGGRVSAFGPVDSANLSIHAAATRLDTNRTTKLTATLADGEPANVQWFVSGGDPSAGPGSISPEGVYTPPSYLTREAVAVQISAVPPGAANAAAASSGTLALTVTPGFLQPLTPANLSVGPNSSVTVSGSITEVGGSGGIRFSLASDTAGTPSTEGSLSPPVCARGSVSGPNPAYTICSVTYTAPAIIPASESVYILGSVASNPTGSWTRVLLNAAGISSDPTAHQNRLLVPVPLGSSSGSNADYDSNAGQLTDCCGGTLGALLQDTSGNQYVLSNNHVFARSDQAIPGETVIQPALIDNGCTPYGVGPGTTPVATLTGYPSLSSPSTNVDAAIARVSPGLVDSKGNVLELGIKQQDGTLAAAPPGVSSTGGKGEAASLGMMVAKSGRTTGLTCAAVSAIDVDVLVDYFSDCAETAHSMTKTFTNQIAISGTSFSDAGDSGALVVDSTNAEPVGLFFAGGTDVRGVEHAIANPVSDVLTTLDRQVSGSNGQTSYTFVGGADHPVSCLSYDGTKTGTDAYAAPLTSAEQERVEAVFPLAMLQVTPAAGVQRVGIVASKDRPGEGAIAFYVDPAVYSAGTANAISIPPAIHGVATVVLPTSALGADSSSATPFATQPRPASVAQVLAAKQRLSASLVKPGSPIFGLGVGQSLDNPADAALVVFVDRNKFTGKLPESLDTAGGQRVRLVLMDRLHVTRSHGTPAHNITGCPALHRSSASGDDLDLLDREPTSVANPVPESSDN